MAMSMRSRGLAAINRQRSLRPVYEDFKPQIESKQDFQANTVYIHLPGFLKEQIRIVAESSRGVLRVRGERSIAGNKRVRFQVEIPVPEDCEMAETRAKFEVGVLRIILPKKIQIPAAPQTPSPTAFLDESPAASRSPPFSRRPPRRVTPPRSPQLGEQRIEAKTPAPWEEHGIKAPNNLAHQPAESSAAAESWRWKEVRGPFRRRWEEDRQLLVNVGVAVLVIAAVGAYVSYSFGTSANSDN